MTRAKRAQYFCCLLALGAARPQILTYDLVARLTGADVGDNALL